MIHIVLLLIISCIFIIPTQTTDVQVIYPTYPTIIAAPLNDDLLNELAEDYVEDHATPSPADFVFIYLPAWAYDKLSDKSNDLDDLLGTLYFSGYWGGIWLRQRLANRPNPVQTAFTTANAQTNVNNAVVASSGATALNYVTQQTQTAVGSFGYNSGYFRTIINNPPTGTTPNPQWNFVYSASSALNASYTTKQLNRAFNLVREWFEDLNSDPDYSALKTTYVTIQGFSYAQGVSVWSNATGLNVQGFGQVDYNTLLKASSLFLEIAQCNALRVTRGVGENSIGQAKKGAKSNAGFRAFNDAYLVGLLDGRYDGLTTFPFPSIQITY